MSRPVITRADLDQMAAALDGGRVIVLPTDTVYGLAARLDQPTAIELIYEIKGRPAGLALPVLLGGADALGAVAATWPVTAASLADRFWPGPLTLVVEARSNVGPLVGGDGRTVGLRWPADQTVQALTARVGPLAVTSANRHGQPPCTTVHEVQAAFADDMAVTLVVDGGTCNGQPSTVIDCTVDPPRCLRHGGITSEAVVAALR